MAETAWAVISNERYIVEPGQIGVARLFKSLTAAQAFMKYALPHTYRLVEVTVKERRDG